MNMPSGATHYVIQEEVYHYYKVTEEGVDCFLGHLGWVRVVHARDVGNFLEVPDLVKIVIEPRVFEYEDSQ